MYVSQNSRLVELKGSEFRSVKIPSIVGLEKCLGSTLAQSEALIDSFVPQNETARRYQMSRKKQRRVRLGVVNAKKRLARAMSCAAKAAIVQV